MSVQKTLHHPASIGPNTLVRTLEALADARGAELAGQLQAAAGLPDRVSLDGLVPEAGFVRLVEVLHQALGPGPALDVLGSAGDATGAYVLAHRIPGVARRVLPLVPAFLSVPVLLNACRAHAWTFAGAGQMAWGRLRGGRGWAVHLRDVPTCRDRSSLSPCGSFYRDAFRHLVDRLVRGSLEVEEDRCQALGDPHCTLLIRPEGRTALEPSLHPSSRSTVFGGS